MNIKYTPCILSIQSFFEYKTIEPISLLQSALSGFYFIVLLQNCNILEFQKKCAFTYNLDQPATCVLWV